MKHLAYRFLASLFCVQTAMVFPVAAEEAILHPDGLNADAGWALSRIGEEFSNAAVNSYSYPDTTVPVRLYLIDTGVSDPASFAVKNPKITFEATIPIGGQDSVPRAHGTQMLSLIAGKETGVASGTPIHVVNYDIYTAGEATTSTTITSLATAIASAVQHHRNSPNPMRAAICIATSSQTVARSFAIEDSINAALAEGIPVIVSAGNLGQSIPELNYAANGYSTNSSYIPSAFGRKDGVICVGASGSDDSILATSNSGLAVDILAPGDSVRTQIFPLVTMTGTSASAALVAGSVLAELSINGSLTPAQVESAIKTSADVNSSGLVLLRTTYASAVTIMNPDGPVISAAERLSFSASGSPGAPAVMAANSIANGGSITPSVDADSDGIPDMVEIFHTGCCAKIPPSPTLGLVNIERVQHVQYKFPIAFDLFQSANPFALGNGYTWGVRCTSNLKTWEVPVGSLSKTTDANGQTWLIATFPAGQLSCFAQIEIHPPAAVVPEN